MFPCKFSEPLPFNIPNSSELESFKADPDPMLTVAAFAIAEPPETFSVPAPTVRRPVETLVPASVSSPAPSFTQLPVPAMLPPNVTAESTVRLVVASMETPPANNSEPNFVASPSVPPTDKARRFARTRPVVESLETLPPLKVSVPVPSARFEPISIVPELIVTPPPKLLEPLRPRVAVPFFTTLPAPLMTPEKLVEVPPLSVSTLPCRLIAPAPRTPESSSEAESLSAPAEPTSRRAVFGTATPPAKFNVPPHTETEPENVLAAFKVSSPEPAFVSAYAPLTTPLRKTELATLRVLLPTSDTPLVKVREPALTVSPITAVPLSTTAFAMVRATAESLDTRPPVISNEPVPSAVFNPS